MHKAYTDNNLDDEIIAYCRCGRLVRFPASAPDSASALDELLKRDKDEKTLKQAIHTLDYVSNFLDSAKEHNFSVVVPHRMIADLRKSASALACLL
ncbi:hypothetical protein [Nitrospira sp. BLG_2]|uniref:hypothetical protein n=1 Tax=Nitrospira sp. BLG_2 TaxID=3397507 RepID=UPI003B9B4800